MDIQKYTDKYFTYTKQILEKSGFDPWVTIQVFIRKGPGKVYGINEAVEVLRQSGAQYVGGSIMALEEGSEYFPGDVVMTIAAPLQLIVEYETIYLGIISKATTLGNGGVEPDLKAVQERMESIVSLVGDREVYYFGARHWHYLDDCAISRSALHGGAAGCSTDASGQSGLGTMPHALVVACGSTVAATVLFNRHIDKAARRVVLVDTFNQELTDADVSLSALFKDMRQEWYDNPPGIRIDTCGENTGEGCHTKGVSVELARKMRVSLAAAGHSEVTMTLSSGFANPDKVAHFVKAEEVLGIRLFDSLGIGQLWEGISATADIVMVDGEARAKTGREAKGFERLKEIKW